ncbi:MAG: S8 family serine peptidase [Anaerolineae bacterium]|nr:S8 family serine peptidase [Anaerolineae bacterium]
MTPASQAVATPSTDPKDQQRVIVYFNPGSKGAVMRALRLAKGQVHYEFDDLGAIAVTLPTQALQGIGHNPNVTGIEVDVLRHPMGETVPYGIDLVQARDVWDEDRDGVIDPGAPTGEGITICVIDSGLNPAHEDFAGANIAGGAPEGWDYDTCGHGTHVAGTIAAQKNDVGVVGVSPGNVTFFFVQVFTGAACDWTYSSNLVSAADICAENGADIISMSLGGTKSMRVEQRAFDRYYGQGILSIAAAGNDGNTAYSYPASYDSVVSVGGVDEYSAVYEYSQQNDQVELAAPGVDVLSTVPWIATDELTVDGVTYNGNHIEFAPTGTASGALVDGGLCDSTGSWSGAVVLCKRGDISFYDKVMNVQNSGGAAAVIYNNEPGNFLGTLGDEASASDIIAISLSQGDGQYLVANKLGSTGDIFSELSLPDSGYEAWSGTSMATPHVSGAAALIWSAYPNKTNAEIREALTATAFDLGDPGRDNVFGYGLVQAKGALNYLGGGSSNMPPVVSINSPADGASFDSNTSIAFAGSASDAEDGDLTGELVWTSDQDGQIGTGGSFNAVLSDGTHTITASVTDSGGSTTSSSITISVGGGGGDTTPPVISNVTSSKIGGSGKFRVTWTTDEPATSQVTVDGLGIFTNDDLVTSHSITISGERRETYEYSVTSVNAAGNIATEEGFIHNN